MTQINQLSLFPNSLAQSAAQKKQNAKSSTGTFINNMKLPIHRWFRYSAGFSAEWVQDEIAQRLPNTGQNMVVLDPFAGSGTTLLAADSLNVKSIGLEPHPFIYRVASTKLGWDIDVESFQEKARKLVLEARASIRESDRTNISLLGKCFTQESLNRLDALKDTFLKDYASGDQESELLWLVITSIIRACSTAGTAQWQYVLPNKKKSKVLDPFDAFILKAGQVESDITWAQKQGWEALGAVQNKDARNPEFVDNQFVDLVITSPPYPNNYDYADATRLEMTFWGEVLGWGDLHEAVRKYLLVSCSQHAAKDKLQLDELLAHNVLEPIRDELAEACNKLAEVRLTRGGKKAYHTMAAAYFSDLGQVFKSLRGAVKDGGEVCFVIGDSAPYGVYLAVDKWLTQLALANGFKDATFEKIRDRNTKWKNRKHRVPLQEGRLWIKG